MEKIVILYREQSNRVAAPVDYAALDYDSLTRRLDPLCHAFTMHVKGAPIVSAVLAPEIYDASMSCVCSIWLEGADHLAKVLPELTLLGQPHGIYLVTESTAREYPKINWKAGTESPGVTLFAAMRRKPEHTVDDFAERWLVHSRISLRLHPIVRYHRNLTLRRLAGDERWDAFTEEHVWSDDDLQAERFCKDPKEFQMSVEDMRGFLNMPQDLQCVYLRERILKLPSWLRFSS
jgi:hypothetical protein